MKLNDLVAKAASISAGEWVLLLVAYAVLYQLSLSVYRVTLHPLAKIPGPFLNKISGWTHVFWAISGKRHLYLTWAHAKYGPIVRNGPNELSFTTDTALRSIYLPKNANVQKAKMYLTMDAATGSQSTHSTIDRMEHAARRRVLSHAFSESAVRSAEQFVNQNLETLFRIIREKSKESGDSGWARADMGKLMNWYSFDVMGTLAFGRKFDCLESDEHRIVPSLLLSGSRFTHSLCHMPIAWVFNRIVASPLMKVIGGKPARDNVKYYEYADKQLRERIEEENSLDEKSQIARKDSTHYLLHAKDPETGRGFSYSELHADASLLIAAGSDTVSTTLAAAIFYLTRNPRALEEATREVRAAFASPEEVRGGPVLNGCKYMVACIDEALRIAPAVPSDLPREVLPGGMDIDGYHIPAGTTVGVGAFAIHHSEKYYPEPYKFMPERWIPAEKEGEWPSAEDVRMAHAAHCPFSIGIRGCLGKNMAMMELKITLARLLLEFDMRLPAKFGENEPEGGGKDEEWGRDRKDEYQLTDWFICDRSGPVVELKPV
ncbi:benzoate 4-monooxygenase cytochrome P450 [Lineolata rhizophorae]|uniref:Benzoate 4-monooxygenase cytochrome P450 n=1 Tax=Lineolata rhizophorae TaxID=578093 RepID=A0A6A6NZU8_9PEZI|nr:benzoate 4-monooxygenase cytochrome P450 [Lineolata rhizophorae]